MKKVLFIGSIMPVVIATLFADNPCTWSWDPEPELGAIPSGQEPAPLCVSETLNWTPDWGNSGNSDGTCSSENCGSNAASLTVGYAWYVTPQGSTNQLADGTAQTVTFDPTSPGTYTIHLTKDGTASTDECSWSDEVTANATFKAYEVTEVEWFQWLAPLSANPSEMGGGARIFTGDRTPSGDNRYDLVWVHATINPPVADQTIHFKVFDPDDTTPDSVDPNNTIDKNNPGEGGDNYGFGGGFFPTGVRSASGATDTNGFIAAALELGKQPGDNHRVAASCSTSEISELNNDNVPPDDSVPSTFTGDITDLLTVWRYLWYEIDAMTTWPTSPSAPERNFDFGTVNGYSTNGVSDGWSKLQLDKDLWGDENNFATGTLTITNQNGTDAYTVVESIKDSGNDYAVINAAPGTNVLGNGFRIYDDDNTTIGSRGPRMKSSSYFPSGGSLLSSAFNHAFIKPTSYGSEHQDNNIAF